MKETTKRYEEQMEHMSKENRDRICQKAMQYNVSLSQGSSPKNYQECLDPIGDGVMGILHIPNIEVHLPIYHGTTKEVLNEAVGHVQGSSLPIGGGDTHCLLAAHRGIPEAELFLNLDELNIGDEFYITVLQETLTYEVCEVQRILPEDTSGLGIQSGKDKVSLITCTPRGIHSHRLVITGERKEGK